MTGAAEFPGGLLHSKYFLNLDNEEKDTICIGCSGGLKTTARRKVSLKPAAGDAAWKIKVFGLKGGHSGVDIHQGRGNALRILGGTLHAAIDQLKVKVASINGGSAQNAIPREASAIVVGSGSRDKKLKALVAQAEAEYKADLGGFDHELQISVEKVERPANVWATKDTSQIVGMMVSLPHGVLAMSPDVPELVQNSTNLAIVTTKDDVVEVVTSQRSAIESSKNGAARMIATALRLAGFEPEHAGSYPGWKPEPNSEIVRKLQAVHEQVFGHPAQADCHARRFGVRGDWRKVSRNADGVVRADHRGSAQSE